MSKKLTPTDGEIERVLEQLNTTPVGAPEYDHLIEVLSKYYKLKADDRPKRVTPDSWVAGGVQILSIIAIVLFERNNAFVSKSIGFFRKPK